MLERSGNPAHRGCAVSERITIIDFLTFGRLSGFRPDTPPFGRVPGFPASLSVLRSRLLRRMDRSTADLCASGVDPAMRGSLCDLDSHRRPRTLSLTEHAESESYIELRGNRICLKGLLTGGRKRPGQWRVHDRNTSKLIFLSMPLHKAFKPLYLSFSVCVCLPRGIGAP